MVDISINEQIETIQTNGTLNTASNLNQRHVVDDMDAFLNVLPESFCAGLDENIGERHEMSGLLEVIVDLGAFQKHVLSMARSC